MATITPTTALPFVTVGDLQRVAPDIPLARVRLVPTPGAATEADVLRVRDQEKVLCELIDGVLVEKAMGTKESIIVQNLLSELHRFVKQRQLGVVMGEGGMLRLAPQRVRIPDGAFVSSAQFPGGVMPSEPVWEVYPDIAIEVVSAGNSEGEIAAKVREYLSVGARLVWVIEPRLNTLAVYTASTGPAPPAAVLRPGDMLSGADVLPGFTMNVAAIFDVS